MLIDPTNFTRDVFNFPKYSVIIDFGVMDNDFKDPYIGGFERFIGTSMRVQLFYDGKLVNEIIEDNPDYLTIEEERLLIENHICLGEEFEKILNFPDGKTFKVEYWETSHTKGENLSIYTANFRKSFLYNKDGTLISELIESNPHYIDDSLPALDYELEDDFLD